MSTTVGRAPAEATEGSAIAAADSFENILGMNVAVLTRSRTVEKVAHWIDEGSGRYVCVSNVHMCMESRDDASFRRVVNGADLVVPDGLPLVWSQRLLGHEGARQVRGADLALDICAYAEQQRIPLGLFGGSEAVIARLKQVLLTRFPKLEIAYTDSPPFRPVTADEDRQHVEDIRRSGTKILFVGLGCPKQEQWMADHRDSLNVVMLGIGAAFDFIAGHKRAAPDWMRRIGLEWLFRLGSEPRRLWRRYLKHNPRFLWYFGAHLVARKLGRKT